MPHSAPAECADSAAALTAAKPIEARPRIADNGAAPVLVRHLGRRPYEPTWQAMRQFTDERSAGTPDELWFLEHPPVYTLGLAAQRVHLLDPRDIPVVQTDRGGQVTYHGPGQLVVYALIDLKRAGLGVRGLVSALERAVIDYVATLGIAGQSRCGAPGVYVGERKLASLGIRIRRGASYHGLALNVSMDLEPFSRINPCGYAGLEMTQLAQLGAPLSVDAAARALQSHLLASLKLRGWAE
ncbi:MAG TPA: lipoyl(octanoyl) transferase LipB [Steroidobacteraceae bacterium]|nr:lipoyl(octanoyl) transferase LipB [Steroidobacteraceae bacterium]